MQLNALLWILLAVALLISAATDLMQRKILDLVTLPTAALALLARGLKEGWGDLERGFLSGALSAGGAALLFALLAWRGRMGWGDVKLMAAVGAAFGYPTVMAALIFVSLAGALQAVVAVIWQGEGLALVRSLLDRWLNAFRRGERPAGPALEKIPYGVAIALGSFWTMWWESTGGTGN